MRLLPLFLVPPSCVPGFRPEHREMTLQLDACDSEIHRLQELLKHDCKTGTHEMGGIDCSKAGQITGQRMPWDVPLPDTDFIIGSGGMHRHLWTWSLTEVPGASKSVTPVLWAGFLEDVDKAKDTTGRGLRSDLSKVVRRLSGYQLADTRLTRLAKEDRMGATVEC